MPNKSGQVSLLSGILDIVLAIWEVKNVLRSFRGAGHSGGGSAAVLRGHHRLERLGTCNTSELVGLCKWPQALVAHQAREVLASTELSSREIVVGWEV